MIQGDIISPVIFILALDQTMQKADGDNRGVKCGRILLIKTLGYADDAALTEESVGEMTVCLNAIGDTSREDTDMKINIHVIW